jgi:hypothetical protein
MFLKGRGLCERACFGFQEQVKDATNAECCSVLRDATR